MERKEILERMDKRLPIKYTGDDQELRKICEKYSTLLAEIKELKKNPPERHRRSPEWYGVFDGSARETDPDFEDKIKKLQAILEKENY